MTLVKDALAKVDGCIDILPEKTFLPHAAAVVNEAADGIAYLTMSKSHDRQRVYAAIAELADYVAEEMGISRPEYFHEAAE
jgi:hypothetical protein